MQQSLETLTNGKDSLSPLVIDTEGAGTAMRFLTAYCACQKGMEVILTGNERMKQRPIGPLVDALRKLGAAIDYEEVEGYPPLHITGGPLHGGDIEMDGSISSQFVSALMMVAPLCGPVTITLTGHIVSRPYIEMTRSLMAHYGVDAKWKDERTLLLPFGTYHCRPLTVEPDWSAASYWLAIEKVASQASPYPLQRRGSLSWLFSQRGHSHRLCPPLLWRGQGGGLQGDSICATLLRTMPPSIDFTDCPDLVQTMTVTYCLLEKPFSFTGVKNLRIKETDRIQALTKESAKFGYLIHYEEESDTLTFTPSATVTADTPSAHSSKKTTGTLIETYGDHRMAMAFAIAALKHGPLIINHPEVVSKSYPLFWEDLRHVGFTIHEV